MNIERKIPEVFGKKVTEYSFDSFDFDDGFLSKIDAEIKNKGKEKIKVQTQIIGNSRQQEFQELSIKNQNNSFRVLQNSNEADPLDFNSKAAKTFTNSISPIHGSFATKNTKNEFSSSTPVRKCLSKANQNQDFGKEIQRSKYDYSEADLFEDWDNDNIFILNNFKKNEEGQITLSQAVQIIEKESPKESDSELQDLDLSINLLTGEHIEHMQRDPKNSNVHNTDQPESFKRSPEMTVKKHMGFNKSLNLNFSAEKIQKKLSTENICLSSDDDNVFNEVCLTPKLYNKSLGVRKRNFANLNSSSSDESFCFKKNRRKKIDAIESDTSKSNLMPTFYQKRKLIKQKSLQGKQYIISEAEVDEEVTSDETEKDSEEYDKSFVDENSYCTQNSSANMTAKYLQSIKNVGGGSGNFKIVKGKPYYPITVFSQFSEEENTDYEIDSFCVADFDDEVKTDLSDLEVAEKILEIDEKKKRKRVLRKFKKKSK